MSTKIIFKYNLNKGFTSVIIPVFKDYIGLKDTLDSLNFQKLGSKCFEIIVSNDGGDEKVTEICKKYRVTMVEIIPNCGSYFARNRALEISKGDFIAFVDADIKVPEDWLEKGINELQRADYVCGPILIDEEKVKNISHLYQVMYAFPVEEYLEKNHFGPTANLFVKRQVFDEIGGFDQRLFSGGDFEFGDRVYRSGKFKQHFSNFLKVIHPPRNYKSLLKKTERVYMGTIMLNNLYPNRFKINNKINLFPPRWKIFSDKFKKIELRINKLRLYYFLYHLKIKSYFIFRKIMKENYNQKNLESPKIINIYDFTEKVYCTPKTGQ